MSFRFRRTFSLLPGVRVNLGAASASVSVGAKGAKLTFGSKGVRATAGIPGTGVFVSQRLDSTTTLDEATQLPPEIASIISDRPRHWECKLLQTALRLSAHELNSSFKVATASGIDARAFSEWISSFLSTSTELVREWALIIEHELPTALGPQGRPGDPNLIVQAVDHLINLTREAIMIQQRASVLARHPVFGALAVPLQDLARPFLDAYNEMLSRLDDQLPKADTTHHIDMGVEFGSPLRFVEFDAALDNYTANFIDEENHSLRTGDVVKDRFQIARGEQQMGEFGRSAIADNLAAGLFRLDDWYWSDDSQQWQPLSALP